MDETQTVTAPLAKIISVWAVFGITSWAEAASAAAFLYTLLLIGEWCWKKFLRDWLNAWRGK